jgi:SAM-dependent methyltransferase
VSAGLDHPTNPANASLATNIASHLACPQCQGRLALHGDEIHCATCGTVAALIGDIVSFQPGTKAYFDERVQELDTTTEFNWSFSYAQQVSLLKSHLQRARTVLDVGCGSRLPYEPTSEAFVIGVDPSVDALRANKRLNLRVHTSAARLPIASASVDLLVCFYSLHHMIGGSIAETRANVTGCLGECARSLVPGGTLFIVENNPRSLYHLAQQWGWPFAKRILGRHLDMFFWSQSDLNRLLVEATGRGVERTITCDTSWRTVIAPIFAVPSFKVPRFLHPLNCSVSIWNKELRPVLADR